MLDCILILKAPFVGGMTGIIIDYLNKWLNFLLFLYFLNNSIFSAIILDVCNTLNCIDSKICIHCFYWNIYKLQNLKIMVIQSQAITCTCTNLKAPALKLANGCPCRRPLSRDGSGVLFISRNQMVGDILEGGKSNTFTNTPQAEVRSRLALHIRQVRFQMPTSVAFLPKCHSTSPLNSQGISLFVKAKTSRTLNLDAI